MTEQVENVETSVTEIVNQAETDDQTSDATGLNITDLAQVKMIIDVAASRGAFKPAEMTIVGATYTKITTFLESITKGN